MNETKLRRIAALHRELAEAYDDLADSASAAPIARPRPSRERSDRAALEAVRRVQQQSRKRGIEAA